MIVARKPQAMPTLRMYKVNLGGVEYTHLLSTQAVHSPRFNGELRGKVLGIPRKGAEFHLPPVATQVTRAGTPPRRHHPPQLGASYVI